MLRTVFLPHAQLAQIACQVYDFVVSSTSPRLLKSRIVFIRQQARTRAAGFTWFDRMLQCRGSDGSHPSRSAKSELVSQLPGALRVEGNFAFSSSRARAREKADGADDVGPPPHYTDDFRGAGNDCIDQAVTAFHGLYSTLCGMLVSSASDALTLRVVDAMGVRLDARDHELLARLDIFGVLQQLLKRIEAPSGGSGAVVGGSDCSVARPRTPCCR